MKDFQKTILEVSNTFGTTWPLYSFATSNPLSGYENLPFKKAVGTVSKLLNASTYPNSEMYAQALQKKEIDLTVLNGLLKANGMVEQPEIYLDSMRSLENKKTSSEFTELDVTMTKWLSAFMDEGLAEWHMPNKEKGFYNAWKSLAVHEPALGKKFINQLPESSTEALKFVLEQNDISDYKPLFLQHMAPLSGWMGYIKHRLDSSSIWQKKYPITFEDYLAVRLTLANKSQGTLQINPIADVRYPELKLKHLWLEAWEQTFQKQLMATLNSNKITTEKSAEDASNLDAQLVFCIDTRSELLRRHIENKGNYGTFGYAGFFGIAMDYQHFDSGIITKSCPPIVGSSYLVTEHADEKQQSEIKEYVQQKDLSATTANILKRLKNMLPSSFGFVEGSGFFYGISLVLKTFVPQTFYDFKTKNKKGHEEFCTLNITHNQEHTEGNDISLDEKVAIVASAFKLMGWRNFAPLVAFVGHGSHSTNNPFASSLDCGACAASPGRHNARLFAKLANTTEVRLALKTGHDIVIPESTQFIGGEHNTTTDEILLFDEHLPPSHRSQLINLKIDLNKAQKSATQERLTNTSNSIKYAYKKATDWDETRPEWGLAKNAAFIIGSRDLTAHSNLDGRCFMHTYNYKMDPDGTALEAIMCGPMVVTQWINNHYYFTTVDTDKFGGGSKITHNITGKFGVLQGNGGDLKRGLPLQSVKATDTKMQHQPLRLTVIIHAPLNRVENILKKHATLQSLLDNEWIYLICMDPNQENAMLHYKSDLEWITEKKEKTSTLKMAAKLELAH